MPTLKYIIDDGGDNTDGLTWATAYRSVPDRIAAHAIGADDLDVIGHDSVDAYAYGSSYTIGARPSGAGWHLVSVTYNVGSIAGGLGSFTYQRSTSLQINPSHTTTSYGLIIDGAHVLFGVSLGGASISSSVDSDEGRTLHFEPHYRPNVNGYVILNGVYAQRHTIKSPIFDGGLTVSPSTLTFFRLFRDRTEVLGGQCINMDNRSRFADGSNGTLDSELSVIGTNFDTTWATVFQPFAQGNGSCFNIRFTNCKMPASWSPYILGFNAYPAGDLVYTNCGNVNAPSLGIYVSPKVQAWTTPAIYRTGGASVEGIPFSWGGPTLGILTSTTVGRDQPVFMEWVPVFFDAAVTKTITAYYASNNALGRPYYAEEVGFEVLYPETSGSQQLTLASTIPVRTTEASTTLHSDDASVWVGDTFTYQRKIELTVTPGRTGAGYIRWIVTRASIAASHDTYLDPEFKVT